MARRITQVQQETGGGGGTYQDPYDQPAFSTWSHYDSTQSGFFCYTHRLDKHSMTYGANNHYGQYQPYSSYAPELLQDNSGTGYYQTHNHVNSHNDYPSMTCQVGYLGHQYFKRAGTNSSSAGWNMQTRGMNYMAHAFCAVNPIVNETKQDWAWFSDDTNSGQTRCYFTSRSSEMYRLMTHWNGRSRGTWVDIPCKWSNSALGSSCYNRKLQKIVVMEQNGGSYTFRPVIWHGVPNLRAIALNENHFYDKTDQYSNYGRDDSNLKEYFTAANSAGPVSFNSSLGYTEYDNWTGKPYNNSYEDQYRCAPVLCDNGKVVTFQMLPHSGAWVHRWNASGQSEGNKRHYSGTTSYGRDQGHRFGMRWQVTSDGRYLCAYCPYYYYGSGWIGAFIRVSDGKWLWDQNTDTSYGYQVCPIGKSSFFMAHTYNTDSGYGMYHSMIQLDQQFAERSDGDRLSPNFFGDYEHSSIETAYHSTSYPALIPAMYNTHLFTTQVEGGRGTTEGEAKQTEFTTYT